MPPPGSQTGVSSPARASDFPAIGFNQVHSTRCEFSPMEQASNWNRERAGGYFCSTFVLVEDQGCRTQRPHVDVSIHGCFFPSYPHSTDLAIWKLTSREEASSRVWFMYLDPTTKVCGIFTHRFSLTHSSRQPQKISATSNDLEASRAALRSKPSRFTPYL